ncbi:unnamed protein product [Orchesella dallaii]|uniref:Uncharacterized protein n=1 Tax=Orchesella dallaii TaxID=48710 RepID=A0ABP1RQ22_9HEXA
MASRISLMELSGAIGILPEFHKIVHSESRSRNCGMVRLSGDDSLGVVIPRMIGRWALAPAAMVAVPTGGGRGGVAVAAAEVAIVWVSAVSTAVEREDLGALWCWAPQNLLRLSSLSLSAPLSRKCGLKKHKFTLLLEQGSNF